MIARMGLPTVPRGGFMSDLGIPSIPSACLQVYSWSAGEQGLILSSFFWGYTVTQVPAGMLAARFGPKWLLFVGVGACSVLSALTPLAAEWGGWQLVVAWRVLQGLVRRVCRLVAG